MNDVLHMLLGASLVCLGVLATALADRIRQLRISRRDNTRVSAHEISSRAPTTTTTTTTTATATASTRAPRTAAIVLAPGSEDVIDALVGAGYKKAFAAQAVLACTAHEQTTPETWMAAALRRCAQ